MTEVYLGAPPTHVLKWIADHNTTTEETLSKWRQIVRNLENYPETFGTELPRVMRDELSTEYISRVSATDLIKQTIRMGVLGYNKSIPARVKYINDSGDRIYVSTIGDGGLLSAIGNGTNVYSSYAATTASGTLGENPTTAIVSCDGNEIDGVGHTYGNNCPYDAPLSVSYRNATYRFIGYNMTLLIPSGVGVVGDDGTRYPYCQFDYNQTNRWCGSSVKTWLNTEGTVPNHQWRDTGGAEQNIDFPVFQTAQITYKVVTDTHGMLARLPEDDFLDCVVPTVNRTWVHGNYVGGTTLDGNQCEHGIDKFWIPGVGHINCYGPNTDAYFNDHSYDSSYFNWWVKGDINENVVRAAEGMYYWLKSAYSSDKYSVGAVGNNYKVGYQNTGTFNRLLPACVIG